MYFVDMLHCFLCDGGADAELQPCGHVAMCHTCAPRVKKCPQCRVCVCVCVCVHACSCVYGAESVSIICIDGLYS